MINQWVLIVSCQILMIINYWLQTINYYHCYNVFLRTWTTFFWSGRQRFGACHLFLFCFWTEIHSRTLTETWEKSGNESNRHQSKPVSCSQIITFWKKKKSISYGCMGTDQLKTMRILIRTGQSSPAFCHTMKWSNVKIYYSYYYKYIYKKRNHFYLWILQGRIDLVNKVLSHVCTYLILIRKWSLCWSFSVSHSLMVQYEKRYEIIWILLIYCTVLRKKTYVVSILTGRDKLQLCIQV